MRATEHLLFTHNTSWPGYCARVLDFAFALGASIVIPHAQRKHLFLYPHPSSGQHNIFPDTRVSSGRHMILQTPWRFNFMPAAAHTRWRQGRSSDFNSAVYGRLLRISAV